MTAAELRARCLALAGSAETFPFGPRTSVFKVGGRMFALAQLDAEPLRVSVKCDPQLAVALRAAHAEVAPGYHLNKTHWNTVTVGGGLLDTAIADMVEDSYDLVVSELSQTARRRLEACPEAGPAIEATLARFGFGSEDLQAWRDSALPPERFASWLTDRVARRPAGARARRVYGAEGVHDFARRRILTALAPAAGDRLLEIGCGGGLLLRDAARAGAVVTGLDHSEDMVALARGIAPGATVLLGRAEALPFPDESFDAVAMSVVFLFLDDPVEVLGECRRVLRGGGRLAVFTSAPQLRGTPAAPEPIAGQGHFYTDAELAALCRASRFREVTVENRDGGQLLTARASHLPAR